MAINDAAGYISRVALAKESVSGTPESSPDVYDYTDEISMNPAQTMEKMNVIQDRSGICHIKSKYNMAGSLGIFGCPEGFLGHLLHGVMGSSDTTQIGATGAYKTVFTAEDELDSYTMWIKHGDVMQTHIPFTVINELKLIQKEAEALKVTAGLIGQKNEIVATYGSEAFSGLCPFNHMEMSIDGSTAAQAIQTSSSEFTILNNINADAARVVNDIFYKHLIPGKRDISGSIVMNFADDSEYQKFLGSTAATSPLDTTDDVALIMIWTHALEAAAGLSYKLMVTIPKVKYILSDVDLSGEVIKQTITWEALYDSVSGYDIEIELTNTESAGY